MNSALTRNVEADLAGSQLKEVAQASESSKVHPLHLHLDLDRHLLVARLYRHLQHFKQHVISQRSSIFSHLHL